MSNTLASIEKYEMSDQVKFENVDEFSDKLRTRKFEDPIPLDAQGKILPVMPEVLPMGTELPIASWRFDDPAALPDYWGFRQPFLVSNRFRKAADAPFDGSELIEVKVSGKARDAAQLMDYAMLRLGPLERNALDMEKSTKTVFQRFIRIKDHHFRDDFMPKGPMFMIQESHHVFVTAEFADRIQCAGITDVQFQDPTVMIPDVGYPLKPMPKDCP